MDISTWWEKRGVEVYGDTELKSKEIVHIALEPLTSNYVLLLLFCLISPSLHCCYQHHRRYQYYCCHSLVMGILVGVLVFPLPSNGTTAASHPYSTSRIAQIRLY